MGVGTIVGFLSAILLSVLKEKMNKKGVADSNGVVSSYLIPGLIAGILSAIFQANGAQYNDKYLANTPSNRDRLTQGGIQLAGVAITLVLGVFSGVVSGFLGKCVNKRVAQEQFDS